MFTFLNCIINVVFIAFCISSCNTHICDTFNWKAGEWEECSSVCDGGTRNRPVICINTFENPVDSSQCDLESKPKDHEE